MLLRDIEDMIEIIKDIISKQCGERKVFDKDVAKALGITSVNLATMKKRKKIPFEEICEFASKKKLDLNYILTLRKGVSNV